jgi:hypothetical protein
MKKMIFLDTLSFIINVRISFNRGIPQSIFDFNKILDIIPIESS